MAQKLEVTGDLRPGKGEMTASQAYDRVLTWFKALNRDLTGKTVRLTYGDSIWDSKGKTWRHRANAQGEPLDRDAPGFRMSFECDENRTSFQDYTPREKPKTPDNPFSDDKYCEIVKEVLGKALPRTQFKILVHEKLIGAVDVIAWELQSGTIVFSNRYRFRFAEGTEKIFFADILRPAKVFDEATKAKLTNAEACARIREELQKPVPTNLRNPLWDPTEIEKHWASWKSASERLYSGSLRLFYWIPDDQPSIKKARLHYVWSLPGAYAYLWVDAFTGEAWVQTWFESVSLRRSINLR